MHSAWDIENKRLLLITNLQKPKSARGKVFLFKEYFKNIISIQDEHIIESYLPEFIDQFIKALNNYNPFYIPLTQTEDLIKTVTVLAALPCLHTYENELKNCITNNTETLIQLNHILEGHDRSLDKGKLFFPVLELSEDESYSGLLESFTIQISDCPEQKFIIIPSEIELDAYLERQISDSWNAAVLYCRNRIRRKIKPHKVIIQFDQRAGIYIGNSLGGALTIAFIEQLLLFYNAPYLVTVNNNTAITGGLTSNGDMLRVGKDSVRKKVEIVFYSAVNLFVVPEEDLDEAKDKLKDLIKIFPKRNLKLIPVQSLDDLLDRRALVNIIKQNGFIRAAKSLRRNYIAVILSLLLLLLFGYYTLRDYDNNPAIFENTTSVLFVKNKNGKILWKNDFYLSPEMIYPSFLKTTELLMDVNNDGRNEVLLCNEYIGSMKNKNKHGRIVCLDYKEKELWDYVFADTISSPLQILEPVYSIHILDTLTMDGNKIIFATAKNGPSFSSAVFRLDAATGKRLPGTFWHPGFIEAGIITDYDSDSKKEIICAGVNNGYERCVILGMDLREWKGTAPTTSKYKFYNKAIEDFDFYIMIPATDYSYYNGYRNNGIGPGNIYQNEKERCYSIMTWEKGYGSVGITYRLDYNLKDFSLIIDSSFRVLRDTLVAHDKLKPPLTDTPEYCKLLQSQILYWQKNKFVRYEEYE